MAVRFDAAADRLVRTSSLPNYNSAYTIMGWVLVPSNPTDYSAVFALDADVNNNDVLWLDGGYSANTEFRFCLYTTVGGTFAETVPATNRALNTWFHVAMVRTSVTQLLLYVNGTLQTTHTNGTVASRTAIAEMAAGGFGNGTTDPANIRVAYLKCWTAALSADQIVAEQYAIRPAEIGSLYAYWPTFSGSSVRAEDRSGNGRAFTENGTLTDEQEPPVAFGAGVYFFPYAVSSGGTTHEGGAGLGAAGWMLSETSRIAIGGAGLGAAGWMLAAGQLLKHGALSVGAAGFIGALGERVALGSAQLGAAGWLSGEGYRVLESGTGQGGAGWLSAETLKILIGAAGLEAIGRINAEASATGTGTTYTGQASLDGHGYILAAAERVAQAASGQGGAGWLAAFGQLVDEAAANLAAAGFINAAGQRVALGAVELPGAGWVNVSIVLTISASATMGAAGYMSVRALAQASQISAGNRTPYSPNTRDAYQPELRTGKAPRARRVY